MRKILISTAVALSLIGCNSQPQHSRNPKDSTVKIASFNVSMDATNYVGRDAKRATNKVLLTELKNGNQQIKNIAEIIQRTRPDIILLNEFDYITDPKQGVERFIKEYLNVAQHSDVSAIDYPYYYYSTVNTGKPSPYDLTGDGKATGTQGDAWGFGFFEGQYGMVLLSKYPIDKTNVRTFQHFKWKDMPGAMRPIVPSTGKSFYSDAAWNEFPLSSKSHWDVPVTVNGQTIHVLASHPTPPVFDGPEDRNGKKNHDEVRFWHDYLTPNKADYIYDDNGVFGGIAANARFVVMGDQNSSSTEGNSRKEAIGALLSSPLTNDVSIPMSRGGDLHKTDNKLSKHHTAYWGMRADYVLPSTYGWDVIDNGVFWPHTDSELYRLVKDRNASSDHRLVWSTLKLK
ncbi:endonuclease/exonuclease/phosphatase family protein [Psychrobium sp. MM17-31]|uniref:endonuclease/exonuclease/phosphatase family protein n=1 Tax=Psychrobium sp. MM17-31 TaxID=2917758 RepID=UPI001EF515FF|nr:endonuclease/exonuclease/phosphatase family protein [Psychrobium sp. MM17-31]MCG7531879.1 endonuclease/exonuclease/phosphatase family protein [Psychrobium sp. MM17-31]